MIVANNFKVTNIRNKEWEKYIQELSLDIDETTKNTIMNMPVPLCMINIDGEIDWFNSKFSEIMEKDEILHYNIKDMVLIDIDSIMKSDGFRHLDVSYNGRTYEIEHNIIKKQNEEDYVIVLFWKDITEFKELKTSYEDEQNVIVLLQIDGYDDVLRSTEEEKRPFMKMEMEKVITSLETQTKGALRRIAKDDYVLVINKKNLKILEESKFEVLENMRKIDLGNTLPATMSIGVGVGGDTVRDNLLLASSSLDLALGRGGVLSLC